VGNYTVYIDVIGKNKKFIFFELPWDTGLKKDMMTKPVRKAFFNRLKDYIFYI